MIAATVVVFTGGGLWQWLHAGGRGPAEMILGLGALLAIAAAGVQGAMVAGAVRRLPDPAALARVVLGQRIAAGLLAGALACMIAGPHV
jgi:hypothetical protein